jgi:hypothetical protein
MGVHLQGSAGQHGLNAVLARFILKVPDIRYIGLHTAEGVELLSGICECCMIVLNDGHDVFPIDGFCGLQR